MIILEISSKSIKHNIDELVFIRDNLNITCSVYKFIYNYFDVECKTLEKGYMINIYDISYDNNYKSINNIRNIFNILRDRFKLNCCYISTMNYKGCINNILNSKCPGGNRNCGVRNVNCKL